MDTVIELEIGPAPETGSYTVEVIESLAGGEPSAVVALDVTEMLAGLPQLETSVLASSVSSRRVMTAGESAIRAIGIRLFDTVFAERIGAVYRASAAVAAERGILPHVALRLTAPELAALPWESLFDTETGRYVSRKEPLVRRVAAPVSAEPPPIAPPLRILGIVSSPAGLPMLDVDVEKERLEGALREHLADGTVELVWLPDTSWSGIQSALLRETWHVLHFIGHGGYDTRSDEGLIALVGSDGRADLVPATSLADLLTEAESTPRLVVLNSCQSGTTGSSDLFAGTAATLVRSGIPAVVAMQFAISDDGALAFARSFYVALAAGRRIGEAVRSGRIGILGTGRDTLEWITPVLYLRGADARLLVPGAIARAEDTASPEQDAGLAEAIGTEAEPPGPPAPAPGRDAGPETPAAAPAGSRQKKSWLLVAIASVVVAGGLTWGAVSLWGGQRYTGGDGPSVSDPVSTHSATPPAPTVLPAVQLAVPGDAYWTPTGVTCGQGDTLTISAAGTIQHDAGPDSTVTPEGLLGPDGLPDPVFLRWNVPGVPEVATASLIGSLDQQEPFAVGSSLTYSCPRAGQLFLGINDINLEGNSGAWSATIVKTDNPPLD